MGNVLRSYITLEHQRVIVHLGDNIQNDHTFFAERIAFTVLIEMPMYFDPRCCKCLWI